MTYNFDPDRWYERERALLARRHETGELDDSAYRDAVEALDRRLDEMLTRLDGSFRLPS
ncbi:MAG: hypothetical protein ACM3O7_04100 [Acidobacteriota bacterium]